jgi:TonB family protein
MSRTVALLLTLCLASPALAGTVDDWRTRIEAIDAQLRAGDWSADAAAETLLDEIADKVTGGPGEAGFVAAPMVQRAIARAGLGDRRGAQWWWWSAQQVLPEIAEADLTSFGDVGAAVRNLGSPPAATDSPLEGATWEADASSLRVTIRRAGAAEPVPVQMNRVRGGRPSARREGPEVVVRVRGIIDAEGKFTEPVLVPPVAEPAFLAMALSGMTGWTSRVDGAEPVAFFATITYAAGTIPPIPLFPPATAALSKNARGERFDIILDLIRAGLHADAVSASNTLLHDLLERGYASEDARPKLAGALALRSAAEAGAGDAVAAEWSGLVADALSPGDASEARASAGLPDIPRADDHDTVLPVKIDANITPPVLKKRVEPGYPLSAKRSKAQGEMVVRTWIDVQGRVRFAELVKADIDPSILVSALEAVRQWRYEPAVKDGATLPVQLFIRVKFNLAG